MDSTQADDFQQIGQAKATTESKCIITVWWFNSLVCVLCDRPVSAIFDCAIQLEFTTISYSAWKRYLIRNLVVRLKFAMHTALNPGLVTQARLVQLKGKTNYAWDWSIYVSKKEWFLKMRGSKIVYGPIRKTEGQQIWEKPKLMFLQKKDGKHEGFSSSGHKSLN